MMHTLDFEPYLPESAPVVLLAGWVASTLKGGIQLRPPLSINSKIKTKCLYLCCFWCEWTA